MQRRRPWYRCSFLLLRMERHSLLDKRLRAAENGQKRARNVPLCALDRLSEIRLTALERNGGDDGTRTRGLCRDSAAWIGFTTTYNNAGSAKLPVSRTRLHELWVGLWVGKSCRWPRARRTGNPLPNGLVSSCTPPVDLLYTEPHGSV